MIRNALIVFDEHLTSGGAAFTSDAFASALATYDQVAFHVVVDTTKGTGDGTLSVKAQQSGPATGLLVGGNDTEWLDLPWVLNGVTVHLDKREHFYGNLSGTPLLSAVRLRLTLGGLIISGHIRIYATMRDASG